MPVKPVRRFTYAIGDVHGRLDLLEAAREMIEAHRRAFGQDEGRVIALGDYIDRGPRSAEVVSALMRLRAERGWTCLKGNHEAMMVRALESSDPEAVALWRENGGDATLDSYGGQVPEEHRAWLAGLPLSAGDAHRLFVHAGVAPGRPMAEQKERDLLWIREAFLTAPGPALPAHVVHGHTPLWAGKADPARPERLAHRTNLDTGAYFTGVLSVGVFADDTPGGPIELLRTSGARASVG